MSLEFYCRIQKDIFKNYLKPVLQQHRTWSLNFK
jgi:hypothetical protein